MKNKQHKKFPATLVITATAILLVLSVTFAGVFSNTVSVSGLMKLSNFVATENVYFEGVADMTPYTGDYGVKVSLKSGDPNFIGNLRVDVGYNGCGVGLVRVRIIEEWSTTIAGIRMVKPFRISIPYNIPNAYGEGDTGNASKWFDNREDDYRFYYATAVHSTGSASVPMIRGIDFSDFDLEAIPENTDLHIVVEADVVQVNRYPQYWKLNALPWADGVSATEEALA